MKGFPPNHILLNTPVKSVTNDNDGRVRLHLENGKEDVYDHVIIATHGDQAHALILPEADLEEKEILSGFQTSKNTAILRPLINAQIKKSLVIMELYYQILCNFFKCGSSLSHLQHEYLATYSRGHLRECPSDAKPSPSSGS
jgi:hypothetical protein